jgi:hypothetical protein
VLGRVVMLCSVMLGRFVGVVMRYVMMLFGFHSHQASVLRTGHNGQAEA